MAVAENCICATGLEAKPGTSAKKQGIEKSRRIEDQHHLQLMARLHELVRD